MNVLLVEDSVDDVAAIRQLAAQAGGHMTLTVLRDGNQASAYLSRRTEANSTGERPQLILLDIGLPGVSGIDVLQWIKREPDLCDVPVVVLSGSDRDENVHEAQNLGAHSYIVKPMTARDFHVDRPLDCKLRRAAGTAPPGGAVMERGAGMVQALNPKDSAVLVVEDNPDDGILIARSLDTFGIRRVYAVETAEDALAFLGQHGCDVALVDYSLPGMNGLRLLERIRESWPEMMVVLVTGVRDEQIAVSAMKAGASDYVTKDELLTSSIIRSLQSTLRRQIASTEERRRTALASAAGGLDAALEEGGWLLDVFGAAPGRHAATPYGEEGLDALLEAFARYLREAFRLFPQPARAEEGGLTRKLLERGASPGEIVTFYRAALRSMRLEEPKPPMNPLLCLVRLFALLVEQYQLRQSVQAAAREPS